MSAAHLFTVRPEGGWGGVISICMVSNQSTANHSGHTHTHTLTVQLNTLDRKTLAVQQNTVDTNTLTLLHNTLGTYTNTHNALHTLYSWTHTVTDSTQTHYSKTFWGYTHTHPHTPAPGLSHSCSGVLMLTDMNPTTLIVWSVGLLDECQCMQICISMHSHTHTHSASQHGLLLLHQASVSEEWGCVRIRRSALRPYTPPDQYWRKLICDGRNTQRWQTNRRKGTMLSKPAFVQSIQDVNWWPLCIIPLCTSGHCSGRMCFNWLGSSLKLQWWEIVYRKLK